MVGKTKETPPEAPLLSYETVGIMSIGAEGESRTHTGFNPQRFLRPPRLPFRHFGIVVSRPTNRIILNPGVRGQPRNPLTEHLSRLHADLPGAARPDGLGLLDGS